MPRASIDYLNRRRALMPASGGKSSAQSVNPVDERARVAGLDAFTLIAERAYAAIAAQRAIVAEFRNRLAAGLTADNEIPF